MFSIDEILKQLQEQLNVLQNKIGHETNLEDFKLLTQEIKIINDLIQSVFKYKAVKMTPPK